MDADDPILDFDDPAPHDQGVPPDPRLTGSVLLDRHGRRIGTVSDVIFDAHTAAACWMVVDPGPFRRSHLVPVRMAEPAGDGRFQVPYVRDVVTHAPRIGRDHVLTPSLERELDRHYAEV